MKSTRGLDLGCQFQNPSLNNTAVKLELRHRQVGNEKLKVAPLLTAECTQILPWCRSIMRLHKAKPSPVPG